MGQNNVFTHAPEKKADKPKPGTFEDAAAQTFGVLVSSLAFVFMVIGAGVVLQALCRCR